MSLRTRLREWAERALTVDPEGPTILVNTSASWALNGEVEKAVTCLEKGFTSGFSQPEWLEHDSYFDSIRDHPAFRAALTRRPS